MSTVCIFWLPQELLQLLAHYFLPAEKHYQQVFKYHSDWRNFMNTSKLHFAKWKIESQIIILKAAYAKKFFTSPQFRERIYKSVENSLEQLELHVNDSLYPFLEFCAQNTIHNIVNNGLLIVFSTEDRYEVFTITETTGPSIRKFHLRHQIGNDAFVDLTDYENLEEASFTKLRLVNCHRLSYLKSITISCPVSFTDVSCFHYVPKVHFHYCNQITDVSSLKNVRELELKCCARITDVSSLGTVYSLSLEGCRNIKDVSALGNVHKLNLNDCLLVRDVSALHSVYELHLQTFQGSNIVGLENVVKLFLWNSPLVSDISMLKNVQELDVAYCSKVFDFRGLQSLKILTFGGKHTIKIPFRLPGFPEVFQKLEQLYALQVSICAEENNGSLLWKDIGRIKSLKLTQSYIIPFPQSLVHLQSLTIKDCPLFSALPELPSLGHLCLQHCYSLKNLHLQGALQKYPIYNVEIESCWEMQQIQVSRKICRMKIIDGRLLSNLTVESQIIYLQVDRCPELTNIINPENIQCRKSTKESIEESLKMYEDDIFFEGTVENATKTIIICE
jgi:hypothetical protein